MVYVRGSVGRQLVQCLLENVGEARLDLVFDGRRGKAARSNGRKSRPSQGQSQYAFLGTENQSKVVKPSCVTCSGEGEWWKRAGAENRTQRACRRKTIHSSIPTTKAGTRRSSHAFLGVWTMVCTTLYGLRVGPREAGTQPARSRRGLPGCCRAPARNALLRPGRRPTGRAAAAGGRTASGGGRAGAMVGPALHRGLHDASGGAGSPPLSNHFSTNR